ncbi:ornithine cyclodeaminase family protein [Aneurinibacillus aneurinilyticus]|uniref:ornithine cyclodeaminase family protein n=1 Tax=Aneurinibacillus aneurinilyticus TaxID=1391 RepID=UPI0035251F4B
MHTRVLSRIDVEKILTIQDTLTSVREAYMMFNQGKVVQPPIMSIDVPEYNGEVDIKAGYSPNKEIISVKTAGGFWNNPKQYNLPTGLAVISLYDAKSGFPVCIMDGTLITEYRTGAAGGVSAEVLARQDSSVVGVIGAGRQAQMQVVALKEILPIQTVKVWSRLKEQAIFYKKIMEELLGIEVLPCSSAKKAVVDSHIVVTTTPSKKPIVMNKWIKPGTHIIAMGADMQGKQELEEAIFTRAKIVVDSLQECIKRGETQSPIKLELIEKSDIHAEIGEILLGRKAGRVNDDEVTIFDSTGMSIQDITTAYMVYKKATEREIGSKIRLI